MLRVTEVAFSCYPVTDMPRARGFYEGVLGLKPGMVTQSESGPQWVEYELGPHTLAIGSAPGWNPNADGGSVGLEVEDFDSAIDQLRSHGVRFRVEPMASPVCRMAVILDPDGNSLVIHKRNAA